MASEIECNNQLQWIIRPLLVLGVTACVLTSIVDSAGAQTPIIRRIGTDSVLVIAGENYRAGSLHRKLLGDNYRDEWTAPITVPVLNLNTFHGGLTPTKEGGGMQAPNLRFVAPDSSEWVFRMVRKIRSTRTFGPAARFSSNSI